MSARAAMEAARAVFEVSSGRPPDVATSAPVWAAPETPCATPRQRAEAMWNATEQTLRAVVGNPSLSGQELIAEVRRLDRLSLDDAHALVALHGWAEQIRHPEPGQRSDHVDLEQTPSAYEMRIASEVWASLERVVAQQESLADVPASPEPPHATFERRETAPAPVDPNARDRTEPNSWSPPSPPPIPETPRGSETLPVSGTLPASETLPAPTPRAWYASPGMILMILALIITVPSAGWWWYNTQKPHNLRDGVIAYERGAPEVARMAFTEARKENPADVTPLIYLGRIDREAHDYPSAKKFLAAAIEQQPTNTVALREMAATLLAEGQPELARRFYVRTLERDPGDRLAQGFLACALYQLGRVDESARWAARAGPGEWSACAGAPSDSAAASRTPPANP